MKITDVEAMVLDTGKNYTNPADGAETHGVRFVSLVKVVTDEGIVGWSDIETQPHVAKAIVDAPSSGGMGFEGLRDLLLGRDADDIDGAWEAMYVGASYYGRAGAVMQVMSGIDIALWDIRGKARGLPICELLGDKQRDSVRAYASTLFRPTPDAMKEAVSSYLDQGFDAIKFGWGPFGQDPTLDISLVLAAREQAGHDVTLMVDAGWFSQVRNRPLRRRTVHEWQPVLRALEEAEIFWLEDCCHPQHYHEYAELAASTSVPIAAGEQEATAPGFVDLMDRGKISVAQPDISRCGGLTVAREVAREAAARGVAVCPHAWLTDLLSATSLHLNAILPTALFQEYNVSSSSLLRTLCKDPIQMKDGRISVPTGAGMGVEVNEAVIERYRVA